MAQKILDHIVVLDMTDAYGAFCTKLMADMGARVIKIEPAGGDRTRFIGPFGGEKTIETGLFHAFYNAGKESVVLGETVPENKALPEGNGPDEEMYMTGEKKAQLLRLAAHADVIVETFAPGTMASWGLGYEDLRKVNPDIIMCSITPFGQTGPCAGWRASSDMIPFALAGPMYESGKPEREPLQLGYNFMANGACMYALAGILAAVYAKEAGKGGDYIDIAVSEAAGAWRGLALGEVQQAPDYKIAVRRGSQGLMIPSNFYRCQDGYIFMMASGRWAQVVQWMKDKGIDIGDKDDPKYLPDQGFNKYLWADIDRVNAMIGELAACYKMQDMMEEGQRRRVPVGVAETTKTVLCSPQFNARNYFTEIEHPVLGRQKYPGAAFGFGASPMKTEKPAPLLGADTKAVFGWLEKMEKEAAQKPEASERDKKQLPLKGIRVLDFGWVVAGPHGGRLLQELGASVIRVESGTRLDPMRIDTMRDGVKDCFAEGGWGFQENSRGKMGLCLNLKSECGRDVLKRLIRQTDVVTCNFAPGGFHKLGLDFETLSQIKKDIIVVNASGLGDGGPYGNYMTFAPVLAAMTGITSVLGYEGEAPFGYSGLLPDYVGGISIAAAVAGALVYRQKTGEGQFIDLSQAEAVMQGMGPALLDEQINGVTAAPFGNHDYARQMAPHNCYPCREENTWIAVAAGSEAEWQRLVAEIGSECPKLGDRAFASAALRLENEKQLDEVMTGWTKSQTAAAAALRLQKAGVSAAPVQNTREFLYGDTHAQARSYFRTIDFNDHIIPPKIYVTGPLIHMGGTSDGDYRQGPPLGRDNEWILKNVAGMDDADIESAAEGGAFR